MNTTPHLPYRAGVASSSPYEEGDNAVPAYNNSPRYNNAPPPAYTTVLRRVYPYSMRPVLLVSTFISFLYLTIVSIASFRSTSWAHETARLRLLDILIGALLLPAAVIEVLGFTAAWTCRLPLARLYSLASVGALALALAADILAIVEHYAVKADLIDGCTADNTGRVGRVSTGWGGWFGGSASSDDGTTPWTSAQAREYCTSQWKRDGIWTIVWLVIILIIGTLFLTFAFTFVHQLRTRPGPIGTGTTRSAFTADDESAPFDRRYSYEVEVPHAYPPPQGMPPQYARDIDAKDPNIYHDRERDHEYHDDEYHTATSLARAESSRMATNRRNSQDTLTDERGAQQSDKTPQI